MQNLPEPVNEGPSALARVGLYVLAPVAGLLLLPILLLFVIALYLLAMVHGARVFVFSFRSEASDAEEDLQKPHFLEIQAKPKALTDESRLPPKG